MAQSAEPMTPDNMADSYGCAPAFANNDADDAVFVPPREPALPRFLRRWYFRGLSIVVLLVYFFLAVPAGAYGASQFFQHLNFADFHPDKGSLLWESNRFESYNFGYFWLSPIYIMVQSDPPGEPLNQGVRALEMELFSAEGFEAVRNMFGWDVGRVRSYYLPGYRNTTLVGGVNNDTMVISMSWAYFSVKTVKEQLQSFVDQYFDSSFNQLIKLKYTVTISSIAALNDAMGDHVLPNMAFIDAIAIPTGLAMFCWATKSIVAVIVPVAVIICSIATALGWGEVLKHNMQVTGFAPELMATAVIALSIDFSLFVVSRLREFHRDAEVRQRFTPPEILWLAYSHVAHNILVSGIAVAAAFGGLAFIKTDFVRSIALLCMIGTLMTLLAALTVIPAVLYFAYPFCFDNCLSRCWRRLRRRCRRRSTSYQAAADGKDSDDLTSESDCVPSEGLVPSTGNNNHNTTIGSSSRSGVTYGTLSKPASPEGVYVSVQKPAPKRSLTAPGSPGVALAIDEARGTHYTLYGADDKGNTTQPKPLLEDPDVKMRPHILYTPDMPLSLWGRAALWSTSHPYVVLLVALAALVFPLYNIAAYFAYDDNFFASSPYTIPCWKDYSHTLDRFQRQIDTPLTVFVSSGPADQTYSNTVPVLSNVTWDLFVEITEAIAESPLPVGLADLDSPVVFEGAILRNISHAEALIAASEVYGTVNATALSYRGALYRDQLNTLAYNHAAYYQMETRPAWPDANLMAVSMRMPIPTYGRAGAEYLTQLDKLMTDRILPARDRLAPGYFVGFNGANANSWYVMGNVMKQLPLEIGITAGMLFLAIALLFRSAFFAVKMLLTMAYTVTCTFGLVIAVFHYGWFDQAWFALTEVDKYFWLIIVIGFSVACVLSLDYDVFLIIRILEFRRQHRFTDKQSAVHAVSRSGPVISYAALIMMIAFGALIFADTVMMAQFGMTLTFAVFLDAFVVRPLIVPALIAVVPRSEWLWFPRRMPPPLFAEWADTPTINQSSSASDVDENDDSAGGRPTTNGGGTVRPATTAASDSFGGKEVLGAGGETQQEAQKTDQ